jgi:hypothetical protein
MMKHSSVLLLGALCLALTLSAEGRRGGREIASRQPLRSVGYSTADRSPSGKMMKHSTLLFLGLLYVNEPDFYPLIRNPTVYRTHFFLSHILCCHHRWERTIEYRFNELIRIARRCEDGARPAKRCPDGSTKQRGAACAVGYFIIIVITL